MPLAAWRLYLDGDYGTDRVSKYAAPARETDFSGLPPTLTFIGSIDPFLAETQSYVDSLRAAGVPVEFRMGGFFRMARAILIRCRCPPDSLLPRSPILV